MRPFILSLSLLISASATIIGAESTSGRAAMFAPSSRLADGRWVKIGIEDSGVYEISHATLRAMGFNDPAKVGVYGRGGRQFSMNFVDADGNQIYQDDLRPVTVIHHGGRLYFYADGPREFNVRTSTSEMPGWYERANRNIYSETGYYFLSDAEGPTEMETVPVSGHPKNLYPVTLCYGMVSHEVDLFQNNTNTGQLYYGETIGPDNPRMEWPVKLPGAIPGITAAMECRFYFDKDYSGTWGYGLTDEAEGKVFAINRVNTSNLRSIAPQYIHFPLTSAETGVYVEVNSEELFPVASNLDYWTLTYPRTIPTLRDTDGTRLNQEEVIFPQLAGGEGAIMNLKDGARFIALDISSPGQPLKLTVTPDEEGNGTVELPASKVAPRVVVFDPEMHQMQIKGFQTGYTQIMNQNLHREAAEGADLVIICIPSLYETARRIAMLHQKYDGIRTLIATTEECYNEFSAGIPDPVAYRALVKAVHDSSRPCKNLLLLGPLYNDFRGVVNRKHNQEGIIAYQSPTLTQQRGAHNANDILGMTDDYIELDALHVNEMQVGVGLLPVRYEAEAETVLEKIERYLKGEDAEYYLNAFTQIGGLGDNHAHDTQAIQLSNLLEKLSDYAVVNSNLPVDAYGEQAAQDKLFNDFNEGRLMVNYFGHGAGTQLNQSGRFFTAADIYRLRNRYLPFFTFAGCSLSNTDRGNRGMGESIVLSTPYGAIGSLLATRETWSGENAVFFDMFFTHLFRDGSTASAPAHRRALTIGEVFALAKSQSSNNNELAYQIIGDPAIILPVTTRRVHFTESTPRFIVGDKMRVTGYVADEDGSGEIDPSFNGKVVARLMEPMKTYISQDMCTGTPDQLRVPVTDAMLSMATGEVINGEFEFDMFVPVSAKEFEYQPSRLHIAVYSPEMRTAGGGLLTGVITRSETETPGERDNRGPCVEYFDFDPDAMELQLRVTDDVALGYFNNPLDPSFRLILDGREEPAGAHAIAVPDPVATAYEKRIPLPNLQPGKHTAQVTVADAAGNLTTASTTFSFDTIDPTIEIRMSEKAALHSAYIEPVTALSYPSDIIIIDSAGETVRREPFTAGGFEWDLTDSSGLKVTPGLYRAYVIQTDGGRRKGHSATIDIPVAGQ